MDVFVYPSAAPSLALDWVGDSMNNRYLTLLITGSPRGEAPAEFSMPSVDPETELVMLSDEVGIDHAGLYQFGAVVFLGQDGLHQQRFENGLRDAMRHRLHIDRYYDEVMARVDLAERFSQSALQSTWFAQFNDERKKKHYEDCVASSRRLIVDHSQELLAEAADKLAYGHDMYDVLDRFNPFRSASINVAVLMRFEAYRQLADYQKGVADSRHKVLLQESGRNQMIFHAISMELTEMSRWFRSGYVERIRGAQLESMLVRLRDCIGLSEHVVVHPERELAYNIRKDLEMMGDCMEKGVMDAAAFLLARALRSMMIPTVLEAMHEIITLVSVAERWRKNISDIEWRLISSSIDRLRGEIVRIDDSKFRRPVTSEMNEWLCKARLALGTHAQVSNLTAAKEHLLRAVRVAA